MRLKILAVSAAAGFALLVWVYSQLTSSSGDTQLVASNSVTPAASLPYGTVSSIVAGASSSEKHSSDSSSRPIQFQVNDEKIAEKMSLLAERRPRQSFNPAEVAAALQQPAAWTHAEKVPRGLPLKAEEFNDGREFIQFNPIKLEVLSVGETLDVPIKDTSKTYTITIDSVDADNYDSLTWSGHFVGDDGQTYQASFSRGPKLMVGGIDTPDGHYVIQAHGSDGWVASSALLFKVDPNHTDALIPPKEE